MGEVGAVTGVVGKLGAPGSFHIVDLSLAAGDLFGGQVGAAGYRFVVVEFGVGGPEIAVAGGLHSEAKVDIVKSNRQILFVEAAHLLVDAVAHQQAGSGDCRIVLDGEQAVAVARCRAGKMLVGMAGNAPETEDDPGVLDGVIRVVKLGTDTADL